MRSAMKKARYFVGIAALAGIMLAATSAQASRLFDFNNTGGDISAYMTNLLGRPGLTVTVDGAVIGVGNGFGSDDYLGTGATGRIEILFSKPTITSAQFQGHVFVEPEVNLPNFTFEAWRGNIRLELYQKTLVAGSTFDSPLFTFQLPVDKLVFTDSGILDVAIDDLILTNPEPSTLFLMGGGLVGLAWMVRRRWCA